MGPTATTALVLGPVSDFLAAAAAASTIDPALSELPSNTKLQVGSAAPHQQSRRLRRITVIIYLLCGKLWNDFEAKLEELRAHLKTQKRAQ
ncbi:unnamed protein product [Phytophthora fragariaefolia]|uniref:Unnamed protein product n=1 Tax=Phytophthora fragariaefolia TaxID=1490495 RepID=A0A9W6X7Z2_9STRA|nr:unnamed protein product [Phytophthora fragariaefolia]